MIYGITGAIATGKSKVLKYISSLGYDVLSLDDISHNLLDDPIINKKIQIELGMKYIDTLPRNAISAFIFSEDSKIKNRLNIIDNILHPLILEEMNDIINKKRLNNETIFIEVPLLYELKLNNYFDKVIYVYINKKNQIERLIKRSNCRTDEAIKKIDAQMDVETKKNIALINNDIIIDNNQSIEYTYKEIDKILNNDK